MSAASLHRLVKQLRRTADAHTLDAATDADLLKCFQAAGDADAFEAILRRHGAAVLARCRKVLSSQTDVEDAFQATFVTLVQNAKSVRQPDRLGAWLGGVAHRVSVKALANKVRRESIEKRRPAKTSEAPDMSWREACAILHEELDRLPDSYRLPLILCYLDGKSRDEAALQLGVKPDALRGRLARGRERLRGRLTKRGIALSAGLLAAVAADATAATGTTELLLQTTLQAAATGKVSAKVAALLHGTAPSTVFGKMKLAAVVVVVIGLLSGGIGLCFQSSPPSPAADAKPAQKTEDKAAATQKDKNKDTKPVAVSGKVVGPDGMPVKAKLFIHDAEVTKPAPQPFANAEGVFAFELPALAEGGCCLIATAPDLGLGCDWVGVAFTEPGKDIQLRLPKDEPLHGRILDLEGKPVVGAKVQVTDVASGADDTLNDFVRLWSKDKEKQYQAYATLAGGGKWLYVKNVTTPSFSATTDAEGRFTLAGIGGDRCPHLTVRAKGMATQVCVVALRSDFKPPPSSLSGSSVFGPEFTLPLSRSVPISGVVRDAATRKPLAGVRVVGQADFSDTVLSGFLVLPDVETATDADGRYTLEGLSKTKKYVVLAAPKAGEGSTHRFALLSDETPGFAALKADLDLPRGVILTGRITDKKTGKPVQGRVFYHPLWSNKWVEEHPGYDVPGIAPRYSETDGWTDADGRFKLTAIPGPGIFFVRGLHGEYLPAKLAAEDDNDEVILLDFASMKTFKTSGQGGHVAISRVQAYRVLRIPADAKEFNTDATVDPGIQREVKIVDPDGKPVSGAFVLNERALGGFSPPLAGAEFTVYALDPDKPRRVYAQHDQKQLAGFITLSGKDTAAVTFKLQPMAKVTGRVLDKDGKPLKDYRVTPSFEDDEFGWSFNTRYVAAGPMLSDAEGKFTLTRIPFCTSVRFDTRTKNGVDTGHPPLTKALEPGETLDLGDWKPK